MTTCIAIQFTSDTPSSLKAMKASTPMPQASALDIPAGCVDSRPKVNAAAIRQIADAYASSGARRAVRRRRLMALGRSDNARSSASRPSSIR